MERQRVLGVLGIALTIALGSREAGAVECAPVEDAQRTSHRRIAWEDFRGERPVRYRIGQSAPPVRAAIATSVALDAWSPVALRRAEGGLVARVYSLCVRAYMHKLLSGRLSEHTRPADLAHEQGHFDVAQVFAGILAARLGALSEPVDAAEDARAALLPRIQAVYRETMAECQATQERYERETSYGNRVGRQQRWERELAARIAGQTVRWAVGSDAANAAASARE
jgi:hypothetical protein